MRARVVEVALLTDETLGMKSLLRRLSPTPPPANFAEDVRSLHFTRAQRSFVGVHGFAELRHRCRSRREAEIPREPRNRCPS
ncbi:MAG: hypothetical protein JNM69_40155 [Archangium sp.]|nr:hypothetical protein [Archangium sp.]